MKKVNKGFTLIELLVVIAIIGILSTLAVVALNSARQKSRDSKRVADVKQIQTALELYFSDLHGYPADPTGGDAIGNGNAIALCDTGWSSAACTGTTYMGLAPKAPSPTDGICGTAGAGSTDANPYVYTMSSSGGAYNIVFCLGSQVGDLPGGLHTADANGMK